MLAFAKDITQSKPQHPGEDQDTKLKQYMDYQRQLQPVRIVYHALRHAKNQLQETVKNSKDHRYKMQQFLPQAFPMSHAFGDVNTLLFMLKKLYSGHNVSNRWYKMNAYYQALVYDCMNQFIKFYNQLIQEESKSIQDYTVSDGIEIDFADWVYLYFNDLDFHIGKELDYTHYPFAKRNKTIEDEIEKKMKGGNSRGEALVALKEKYEIDDCSIKVLLSEKISKKDLELFYTSAKNPIYDYLKENQKGSWNILDGESLLDQAYAVGSRLKIWVWKKKEKKGRW